MEASEGAPAHLVARIPSQPSRPEPKAETESETYTEVEGSGEGAEELLTAEEVPLAYETLPPPKEEPQAAPSQAEEVDAEAPTSPAEPLPKEEPQSAEREEPPQQDSQVKAELILADSAIPNSPLAVSSVSSPDFGGSEGSTSDQKEWVDVHTPDRCVSPERLTARLKMASSSTPLAAPPLFAAQLAAARAQTVEHGSSPERKARRVTASPEQSEREEPPVEREEPPVDEQLLELADRLEQSGVLSHGRPEPDGAADPTTGLSSSSSDAGSYRPKRGPSPERERAPDATADTGRIAEQAARADAGRGRADEQGPRRRRRRRQQ